MMRQGFQMMVEASDAKATDSITVLRRLSTYLRPYKGGIGLALLTVLISSLANLAGPFLIGLAIDQYIINKDIPGLTNTMILLFISYAIASVATGFTFYNTGGIGQRTLATLRNNIFNKAQQLSLRYFDTHSIGDLMSRLVNDVDTLSQILSNGVIQLISASLSLFGILVVMLWLNWQLALASFVVIPLMFGVTYFLSRRARVAYRETRKSIGAVSSNLEEQIQGVRVAQAFNRVQANQAQFAQLNRQNRNANVNATAITSAFTPTIDVLSTLATAIVAGFGGILVLNGYATVGLVVAFLGYVQQFFRPVQQISGLYAQFQSALAGAERIFNLLDEEVDQTDKPGAIDMPPIQGNVEFDHVYFTYGREANNASAGANGTYAAPPSAGIPPMMPGRSMPQGTDGKPVSDGTSAHGMHITMQPETLKSEGLIQNPTRSWILEDVSFTSKPGQTIALVGPTGAGKTTIVNLINRFYDVDQGRVTIDGYDVRDVTRASLRSQIALVLQDTFLFAGTVAQNIRYGRVDATDEEVEQAARMVNAHEFIMRMPEGYATMLGERGQTLSQGQRQLLSFARAIIANPRILILDEATSNVDTRTEVLIQTALKTLLQGRTSFVIAHRLSTIRNADQVLVIEDGKIVESGTHTELMARGGHYHSLYSRQFRTIPTEEVVNTLS